MATLNKLSIQGVRSVGPGEEDRVDVKFFRPFTLITGENGAGKTTIIEALKFASTGSFPPGAGKTNGKNQEYSHYAHGFWPFEDYFLSPAAHPKCFSPKYMLLIIILYLFREMYLVLRLSVLQ